MKHFRKKIILEDIHRLTSELQKNQEFINLFLKNNNDLLKQIAGKYEEVDAILIELSEEKVLQTLGK